MEPEAAGERGGRGWRDVATAQGPLTPQKLGNGRADFPRSLCVRVALLTPGFRPLASRTVREKTHVPCCRPLHLCCFDTSVPGNTQLYDHPPNQSQDGIRKNDEGRVRVGVGVS